MTSRADLLQRARLYLGRGNNLVAPLSEMQAVALAPQIDALPERNGRRTQAVDRLARLLEAVAGVELLTHRVSGSPSYYKVGLRLDANAFGLSRKLLTLAVRAEGVALDEGFRALAEGSRIDCETLKSRALGNYYVGAEEALELGLIAGLI